MDVEAIAPPGRFAAAVDAALEYAGSRLLVEEGEDAFFAYYQGSRAPIHNASLLVASVYARRGRGADASPRPSLHARTAAPGRLVALRRGVRGRVG
jgi:hypothetical protein